MSSLKLGIHSVFGKVGCSSALNLELLGSEGVTEANLMQYLGIIEQRTHEILQLYAASQPQASPGPGHQPQPSPISPRPRPSPTRLSPHCSPAPNAYLPSGAAPLLAASQVQARDAFADAGSGAGGAGPSGMAYLLGQGPQLPAGSYSISIRPPSTGEDDGSESDEVSSPTPTPAPLPVSQSVRHSALAAVGRAVCCEAPAWRAYAPSASAHTRQDSAEEEEEEARPLSRDELTAKTTRGLYKREAKENTYKEQRRNKRLVANKGQL